jgi:dCMP deaminase
MNKHEKYMELATFIGDTFSKDRSTKVGCVIIGDGDSILSTGYNGFVRHSDDDREDWHDRPMKYSVTEHSERNAIYNAARHGIKLLGSRIYISSMCPCVDCSRAICQSGISKVYLTKWAFDRDNPRGQVWMENWHIAKEMLDVSMVEIEII